MKDAEKVLWEQFQQTGNISYYLLYNAIRKKNGG